MAKRKRSNPPGRAARRPARPAAGRAGRFILLYGVHASLAALSNRNRHCRRLLVTEEAERRLGDQLHVLLDHRRIPVDLEVVERAELDRRLPPGAVHQGIAVEAEPLPEMALDALVRLLAGRESVILVALDHATDPQNVGAVLRSAAAFGAAGVIVTDRHAPAATGALAKAAAGALELVPLLAVVNLARALRELKDEGYWCVGLDNAAERILNGGGLPKRIVLVLGAEGAGLRRLTRECCDLLVRIPVMPAIESLNVSTAAAVALYELHRRHQPAPQPQGQPRAEAR
jgi:23S rRNA (guanosine2251-2'-O)-methyltransferase